jgi:TolA-binding protein
MSARWIPEDSELDAVARTLEPHEPVRESAEQNRTALLAAAATRAQLPRRSSRPYVLISGAIAAAAAVAVWFGTRPSEPAPAVAAVPAPKQVITPIGVARFVRETDWADFVVRLDDGKIAVQVAKLESGERFRVKTADAEVEVRGTRFDVGADRGRLASVDVHEGSVEIRRIDQQVIILSAGESWAPVQTVEREDVVVPAPGRRPEPTKASKHASAVVHASASRQATPAPAPVVNATPAAPGPPAASPKTELQVPVPAKPGEAEFRAGMAALRSGDAAAAAAAFTTACGIAKRDALGEDACFWAGAAAKRAGDTRSARSALAAFLQQFPKSARASEAAALLGWIVYDAGDLDAAESLFHKAEADRVPQVRDSAQRGLTAIERKRGAP